ncbi:envelope stress response membrane protein PspC [Vibrio sp. SS-MA-C1-2]|uniref:envelope stress response membrane protein PspC n=1 Tax=Vibrio sp. SS-MA-C1-2 TaxID=2908646 RepID=UPI001F1958CA|nr:envelope stress response membrane protein PspC [Vibrio sp. SS-MA-C1-2]UJF19985.1 envelope stress response membrane protein PspC [Vibrio sp. SS-MA-C1-2]
MNLYRDTKNGKIKGVCAGIAAKLGIEVWLVRILAISALLLGGSFIVILAYIVASLMLDKMPEEEYSQTEYQRQHTVKKKPWQNGNTPQQSLQQTEKVLNDVEDSVRQIERYVTSTSFQVNREFKNL